jgi:hypothetical protein
MVLARTWWKNLTDKMVLLNLKGVAEGPRLATEVNEIFIWTLE